jgi:hypothetical protein
VNDEANYRGAIAACHQCGAHYRRTNLEHTLCLDCFRWDRTLRRLEQVQRAPSSIDRRERR